MIADDERREVARRLRSLAGGYVTIGEMEDALGICMSSPIIDLERDARDLHRLSDLIDPGDLGDPVEEIKNWCLSAMEGADGALDTMLCEIVGAIEEYQHPELASAETERAVDRDALLALAEDVDEAAAMATVMDASEGAKLLAELLLGIAHRIREACGEVEQ